jgi:hypothetical protein
LTTLYAITIFAISSIFLFSTKTEHHRVVTIQKPIVITQERRTPAFFAYQQSQLLRQKKSEPVTAKSTFLTNLNEQPQLPKFQLAEMRLTKSDYAAYEAALYRSRMIAGSSYDDGSHDYEKVIFQPDTQNSAFDNSDAPTVLSPERRWAVIQGKFELRDGVGITDHIIDIKRVEEGLVREQGRINLNAGTYSIEIESPNGYLVAEVRDKSGLIIGEDRQRLVNLQGRGAFLEGPFIKVRRPDSTLAGNPSTGKGDSSGSASTAGAASTGWASQPGTTVAGMKSPGGTSSLKASPSATSGGTALAATIFNDQKIFTRATDEFSNVSSLSSTIARIYDPAQIYNNVVTVRMAGEKTETPMFTKNWLANAVNLISKEQQLQIRQGLPVVIGRVVVDGQPMAGAQVQIERQLNAQAIYLDQFLNPSRSLSETTSNGYFMFIGVDPGAYDVVAFANNRIIGSQLFSAENASISFQNIYTRSIPVNLTVRSYDAFTSDPVETDIYLSSQDEIIQTAEGSAAFRSYVENNVSDYAVRTADTSYVGVNLVQSGKKEYVHIPMIQEKWLTQIKKMKLINDLPSHGTVIGFTPQLKYEVFLASDHYDKGNVVYFTKDGEIASVPQANGGFIMFNVPVGAKEVVLNNLENEKIFSQALSVHDQQVSAITFND